MAVVYAGYAGRQLATANLAPTVISVLFWVAIPFASVLFGDVFRAVNPWLALAKATGWVARPADGGTLIAAAIPIAGRLPQART